MNRLPVVYTEHEVFVANNAARAGAHITKKAVTLLVLEKVVSQKTASILDYGAGPFAYHTKTLRRLGYQNVTAHDFGKNFREGTHDPDALSRQYDVVYACNVLNAQNTRAMLEKTIYQLSGLVKPIGLVLCNLAQNAIYHDLNHEDTFFLLCRYFGRVRVYPHPGYRGVVWMCEDPAPLSEPIYCYLPRPDTKKNVQTFRSTHRRE